MSHDGKCSGDGECAQHVHIPNEESVYVFLLSFSFASLCAHRLTCEHIFNILSTSLLHENQKEYETNSEHRAKSFNLNMLF